MSENLLTQATPAEYFKDLVSEAVYRQKVEASEFAVYHLCAVLHKFLRPNLRSDVPLALRLGEALEAGGVRSFLRLKNLGDVSLFVSGFFSESLNRKFVDVDYYVSMGAFAYSTLSHHAHDFQDVFAEVAKKFVPFTDVLADVRDHTSFASDFDLMRSYEKWLRTGSEREYYKLVDHGIVPSRSMMGKLVQ